MRWKAIETAPRDGRAILLSGSRVDPSNPFRVVVPHPMVGRWDRSELTSELGWIVYRSPTVEVEMPDPRWWLPFPEAPNDGA